MMQSIKILKFSRQTHNALKNNKIETIKDLICLSNSDLEKLKGFDDANVQEIVEKVEFLLNPFTLRPEDWDKEAWISYLKNLATDNIVDDNPERKKVKGKGMISQMVDLGNEIESNIRSINKSFIKEKQPQITDKKFLIDTSIVNKE